jgi:hypothetical protein
MNYIVSVERLLLIVWVGGMWTVGFVVAPTLFAMLDSRATAGSIAGKLFSTTAYLGLVCGVLLLGLVWKTHGQRLKRHWQPWVVAAMLASTAIGQFVVSPLMREARAAGLSDPAVSDRFQLLHGVSTTLFVITSLLGLVIAWFGIIRPVNRSGR